MSKPDDIPQDVWDAALIEVAGAIPVYPHDKDYVEVADRVARWATNHVADAIKAERERAAKAAEAVGAGYGDDETGWLECSETIATAIRNPPPLPPAHKPDNAGANENYGRVKHLGPVR